MYEIICSCIAKQKIIEIDKFIAGCTIYTYDRGYNNMFYLKYVKN